MQNERHQEESGGPNASEDSLEESIKRVERLGKELEEGEEEVSDQEETEVKRYNISVEDAKRRVAENKDYLSSIANTPFSNALPQPHLERHQAYLLFGGYLHSFKRLETVLLGMTCFPFSLPSQPFQTKTRKASTRCRNRIPTTSICNTSLWRLRPAETYSRTPHVR